MVFAGMEWFFGQHEMNHSVSIGREFSRCRYARRSCTTLVPVLVMLESRWLAP
jgi:hypothetical protein